MEQTARPVATFVALAERHTKVELQLRWWSRFAGEKSVVGGQPGSIGETEQMLTLIARHRIKPTVEPFSISEVNAALDYTRQGRAVLVA